MTTETVVTIQKHPLYERALIGGQYGMFPFEQTIYWIRKAEAEVVLRHGGVELMHWACFVDLQNDFLGCVDSALSSYQHACKHYGIVRGSTLQAVIRVTIEDIPHTEASPASPGAAHGLLSPIERSSNWSIRIEGSEDAYRPLEPTTVEVTDILVSTTEISAPVKTSNFVNQFVKHHRKAVRDLNKQALKAAR